MSCRCDQSSVKNVTFTENTSRLAIKVKKIDEIQGEAQIGEKSLEN